MLFSTPTPKLQTLAALIGRTIVTLAQRATNTQHLLKPDFVAEFMVLCITSLTSHSKIHRESSQALGGSTAGRQLRLTMLSELPFGALLGRPGMARLACKDGVGAVSERDDRDY